MLFKKKQTPNTGEVFTVMQYNQLKRGRRIFGTFKAEREAIAFKRACEIDDHACEILHNIYSIEKQR
jgi:hypothetical protein